MTKSRRNKGLMKKISRKIYNLTKHKTFKNKVYAIALEILAIMSVPLLEKDITIFIFLQFFALPLFFEKENVIVD